ncbi:MAG: 16S rRNA (uracil(1498)-N(3))-methyltransferase, partial [Actinomycetota bacterium]
LLALDAVLDEIPHGEGFLLDPRGDRPLGAALAQAAPPATVRLVVGPDTGLSPAEARRARAAGLVAVTLGAATLRAETAAIAAAAVAADHLARAGAGI